MRAARYMIRRRGGPAAFQCTPLGRLVNWQDYILPGYETYGSSFSFEPRSMESRSIHSGPPGFHPVFPAATIDHGHCSEVLTHSLPSPFSDEGLQHHCEEFIGFLKRCEQLFNSLRDDVGINHVSKRHTAFHESSLQYQILGGPEGERLTKSGSRKQFIARFAALIMLNAALLDYRGSKLHTNIFLETLENTMRASEVNMSGSVEALLQILLACNDGAVDSSRAPGFPDFTQYSPATQYAWGRPWFTGKMLKVAKRLSLKSWLCVQELLFSYLSLRPNSSSVPMHESYLRQEILSAPPTSYEMPALQQY